MYREKQCNGNVGTERRNIMMFQQWADVTEMGNENVETKGLHKIVDNEYMWHK